MAMIVPWETIDWITGVLWCGVVVLATVLICKGLGKIIDAIRYKRKRWM